ncbi:MAG TPA: hypothetical protein VLC09_14250 [Polyangiaceae bacterium]|nr:hypothetical protein [Polyangiaceae bacterium]
MSDAAPSWQVLGHGPLLPLADNLRWVSGDIPRMSLKRCMTVARLGDGRLVIHNAIALDEAHQLELERFGTPAFLVVPSAIHRMDAPAYKARYPDLVVVAPRGARKAVEERLPVDLVYDEFASLPEVQLEPLAGVANAEGILLVHSADGTTVVLNDVVMNMDRKKDVLGWLFTTAMGSAPGPRVSRLSRMLLVKDRGALRADLLRLAELPNLTRLIVAHEKVASGPEAAAALKLAATFL